MSRGPEEFAAAAAAQARTPADLAWQLRQLRRREARRRGGSELTYRELAAKTGWSHAIISGYFTGKVLAPTDRFDALVCLLGASPAEQGALATARDLVEELRRSTIVDSPAASVVSPAAADPQAASVVPRQLPLAVPHFVGRSGALAVLSTVAEGEPGSAVLAVIAGMAGIGKTSLALHWAHRATERYPDGQLYVNLRGFDPSGAPLRPEAALRAFLDALGVPAPRVPADLAAQAGLYRSLLSGRRILVVLDNARDTEQVRPLLPGAPGCLALVTSRHELPGLVADGAHPVPLDLLDAPEARELLAHRVGPDRVAAEPAAVDEIVSLCAGLPLGLAITAARAAARPAFSLAALAAELRGVRGALDALDGGDASTDARAVFSWSYRALSAPAARLFRLLGLHPGPEFGIGAAASLAAVPVAEARRLLAELARAHLVSRAAVDRFAMHDLLLDYAAELVRDLDSAADRSDATRRMFDHYLYGARTARLEMDPHLTDLTPAPEPPDGVAYERPTGKERALAWFAVEYPIVIEAARRAQDAGLAEYAWQFSEAISSFFYRLAHWRDWVEVERIALRAAEAHDNRTEQTAAHRRLARGYLELNRFAEAMHHNERALGLAKDLDDPDTAGEVYLHQAIVCERQGRFARGARYCRSALDCFRASGNLGWQASAHNCLGWCVLRLGRYEQAMRHCLRSLALYQEAGADRYGAAAAWDTLGYVHHHRGAHADAVECFGHALEILRKHGHLYEEAETLIHLGESHLAVGDRAGAEAAWRQARSILDDLHVADDEPIPVRLRQLMASTDPGT